MGAIPPPPPVTRDRWLADGKRDLALERWLRERARFRLWCSVTFAATAAFAAIVAISWLAAIVR